MYSFLKFFLFLFSAENAHSITTAFFKFLCGLPFLSALVRPIFAYEHSFLETNLWGLRFKNPVGLAAGFDKDGDYIKSMAMLGFGFIELGTVTPRPQVGNPKPRLFRLVKDKAIINRMGFNNKGVDFLVQKLKSFEKGGVIIGGNIGKNKDTPNEEAYQDYLHCFSKLYPYVDYFVVNLSSPNTPGLRSLQEKKPLKKILTTLLKFREDQEISRPVLLKIAPDLSPSQLDDVVDIVQELKIDGIIATNTTIDRSRLITDKETIKRIGNGGLSGKPLFDKSTRFISDISLKTKGTLPLVAVGGIDSPLAAIKKMTSGASLIQVYSGLIYEGPFLVKNIKKKLVQKSQA